MKKTNIKNNVILICLAVIMYFVVFTVTKVLKTANILDAGTTQIYDLMLDFMLAFVFGLIILLLSWNAYLKYKITEKELMQGAYFDWLTMLPNRKLLYYTLEKECGKDDAAFALFYIDLDNFKNVNDRLGHDAGDAMLTNVANFFRKYHKSNYDFDNEPENLDITCRLGGDEFIVVVSGIETKKGASDFAEGLIKSFNESDVDGNIAGNDVFLSVGVSVFGIHSKNYMELLKFADIALYNSKNTGKNRATVYRSDMKLK